MSLIEKKFKTVISLAEFNKLQEKNKNDISSKPFLILKFKKNVKEFENKLGQIVNFEHVHFAI